MLVNNLYKTNQGYFVHPCHPFDHGLARRNGLWQYQWFMVMGQPMVVSQDCSYEEDYVFYSKTDNHVLHFQAQIYPTRNNRNQSILEHRGDDVFIEISLILFWFHAW